MDTKKAANLFQELLRIRMVEEAIADEYKNQQMRCPTHLSIGQEAIACGVCANLTKKDVVFSNHRSHSHYLAKGGSLSRMLAEIYGKATGCSGGRGGSQHLIDMAANFLGAIPIVAETIPLAVGNALSSVLLRQKRVSVAFFGDAAIEEGVTHESLNFAILKKLPVLFVCENNFYSIYTHIRKRQPKREIFTLAAGHGIASYQEDGNDVIKVYHLAKKVLGNVRNGKGPAFIEFLTYRLREHVGPNFDPPGARPVEEYKYWERKDPIKRFTRYVLENKKLHKDQIEVIKNKISREIKSAFDFAKKSPYPKELFPEKLVYA